MKKISKEKGCSFDIGLQFRMNTSIFKSNFDVILGIISKFIFDIQIKILFLKFTTTFFLSMKNQVF